MDIEALLCPNRVHFLPRVSSKRKLLQILAEHASVATGLDSRVIFEGLHAREQLGSTGVGHGVAIPHAKGPKLEHIYGVFIALGDPVVFESVDDLPVDLVFMLLAPEGAGTEHLKALARVSRLLRNKDVCRELRSLKDVADLQSALIEADQ